MGEHTRLEIDDSSMSSSTVNIPKNTIKVNPNCWWILVAVTACIAIALSFVIVVRSQHQCSGTFFNAESSTSGQYKAPQLYLFGGLNDKYDTTQILLLATHYNSSSHKWDYTTNMPFAMYASCGAVIGTKIYLFGGSSNGPKGFANSKAEVYDSETGTYSSYRGLPYPTRYCGAAALGNSIYVAGGADGWGITSDVIRYNINTTRREKVSSMHFARSGLQLVELGGLLYAIGGQNLRSVEMYNPTTDKWSMVAMTHFPHEVFGAAAHDGKIYVCSHLGFEVYDPRSDQWTDLEPPHNFYGSTLVSMNGLLWSLGGCLNDHHCQSVYTYNPDRATWNQMPDMPLGRRYHTSFVVNH